MPSNRFPDQTRTWKGMYYIDIPVTYSGVPQHNAVFIDNFRFTLTSAAGGTWTSPWQHGERATLPSDPGTRISLMLSPAIFHRFQSEPVDLSIEFGVSNFQADAVNTVGYPDGDAAIPGVGFCQPQVVQLHSLLCRSTQQPKLTYATIVWSNAPCSDPPTSSNTAPGDGWLNTSSVSLRIASVETPFLWFRNDRAGARRTWHICPGSPLVLTQYQLAGRTRVTLAIPGFQFPPDVTHTGLE